MVVHPDGDGIAVEANMGGATSPFCLEGWANGLMLGEAREAAPSLEEEAEAILNATTNPESGQGKSPEVRTDLRDHKCNRPNVVGKDEDYCS